MSIGVLGSAWKADGTLSCVQHEIESESRVRRVLACKEIQGRLSGPWGSGTEDERLQQIKAVIDLFIAGQVMAVRIPPSTSAKAQLACLNPWRDCVWEFRTRPVKKKGAFRYGVRVFGMFASKDLFVAMRVAYKEDLLLTEREYRREVERCKRIWRMLFPSFNPRFGDSADDYLSNFFPV
jgi:hypothetical protein